MYIASVTPLTLVVEKKTFYSIYFYCCIHREIQPHRSSPNKSDENGDSNRTEIKKFPQEINIHAASLPPNKSRVHRSAKRRTTNFFGSSKDLDNNDVARTAKGIVDNAF